METLTIEEEILVMISEITMGFAVEMANKLHKQGTSMGLAIYKAAKYYQIDQHQLAVKVGKLTKRHKEINHHVKPVEHNYWWDNK